jgi:hypothetical protein
MKPARLLTIAALLAPRARRAEWLDEWHSELWYVQERSARTDWEVLRFCLGAFVDAWWVRRAEPSDERWIGSPAFCLVVMLAVAAAAAVPFAKLVLHGGASTMIVNSRGFALNEGLILLSAFAVLLSLALLGQGRFIEESHLYNRWARLREGMFLAVKLLLAWSIVFCGTCDAAICFGAVAIRPHTAMVGHVLFFRWVMSDQRRRCPVCLRPLASVCQVGEASRTFLERYGSESGCARGHGVMFTPAVVTNYTATVWRDATIPDSPLSR